MCLSRGLHRHIKCFGHVLLHAAVVLLHLRLEASVVMHEVIALGEFAWF